MSVTCFNTDSQHGQQQDIFYLDPLTATQAKTCLRGPVKNMRRAKTCQRGPVENMRHQRKDTSENIPGKQETTEKTCLSRPVENMIYQRKHV